MTQPNSSNGRPLSTGEALPAAPRPATRWQKALAVAVIAYGLAIVGLWAWMVAQGDRQWLATLLLFGPRWLCGVPLPFLALAAAIWYRRLLWVLVATAIVLVGPFMGFKAHLPASASTPFVLRVLTCNVDQNEFDVAKLAELILGEGPDVVALQEVSTATRFVWPDGWHVAIDNEFILASRWPIIERRRFFHPLSPIEVAAVRYRVELPDREVQLFNLHLETPRPGFEAMMTDRLGEGAAELDAVLEIREIESQGISDWVVGFEGPKIVMGDFNMPGESTIFRRDWTWLDDAFARTGWGFGFTKFQGRGWLSYGARIDHVLYSQEWDCVRSWVGFDIGSDHRPLLAEFE
jgi:endonuclease/exonuclease/phosphatase (EEP) superfamily protein YafD